MKDIMRIGFFLFILATAFQLVIKAYNLNAFWIIVGVLVLLAGGAFAYYNYNKSDKKEREIRKAYHNELLVKKLASNDDEEDSSEDTK